MADFTEAVRAAGLVKHGQIVSFLKTEYGYLVGVVAVTQDRVETPQEVAAIIRSVMGVVDPERLFPCTNCGMAPIPYDVALGKIRSLAAGASLVRQTL